MPLTILRLGHRIPRDERISTHVALVARAWGADELIYTGQHDGSLESSVLGIVRNWGGSIAVRYEKDGVRAIKNLKKDGFAVVHLTMYGIPLPKKLETIRANKKLLVIVGGEQVPREVYELADFNIAITSQPHSEVAALAVFLDRLQQGKALEQEWNARFDGKLTIEPSERGKVIRK